MRQTWKYALVILIGMFVIGIPLGLLLNKPESASDKSGLIDGSQSDRKANITDTENQSSSEIDQESDDEAEISEIIKEIFTEEDLEDENMVKLLEVLESPKFEKFLDTEPKSLGQMFDYFASQGIPVDKEKLFAEFDALFKEQYPVGTPEYLEREMHKKLGEMVIEADIKEGTNEGLDATQKVMQAFFEDEKNGAWMLGYFKGDHDAFADWFLNVIRNPDPYLLDAKTDDNMDHVEVLELPSDKPDVIDKIVNYKTESTEPNADKSGESSIPTPDKFDDPRVVAQKFLESEPQIEEYLRQRLPPDQFSRERFLRAIGIINTFGDKEGIEKLKSIDPDISIQFQRLIRQRNERGEKR